jgi:hypothetical protein
LSGSDDLGYVTNVQYKFNQNCHYESPLYNEYILIKKEILELNDSIDQMDLTHVYRLFHPAIAQYTFFSAAHRTFSKIDCILSVTKQVLKNITKLK